jgi:hypothetical protein
MAVRPQPIIMIMVQTVLEQVWRFKLSRRVQLDNIYLSLLTTLLGQVAAEHICVLHCDCSPIRACTETKPSLSCCVQCTPCASNECAVELTVCPQKTVSGTATRQTEPVQRATTANGDRCAQVTTGDNRQGTATLGTIQPGKAAVIDKLRTVISTTRIACCTQAKAATSFTTLH